MDKTIKLINLKLDTPRLNFNLSREFIPFGTLPTLAQLNLKTDENVASQNIMLSQNFILSNQLITNDNIHLTLPQRLNAVKSIDPFNPLTNSPLNLISNNNLIIKSELNTGGKKNSNSIQSS